ncbi:MAG: DUF512 domain-containing protein [Anaerolineae bacterium]
MTRYFPALITGVEPGSLAAKAGLRPGDRLLALNGEAVRDVIDVQILTSESEVTFLVERGGKKIVYAAERRYGQTLGLSFAEELFDRPLRVCRNHCDFCFVDQMPPELRSSLYVKDDDYRLSFLHGNYVTLTNLEEADWARIEEQFLSPLYVSVHATEPEIRRGLLHHPRAGGILTQLEKLAALGIEVHTQAVLVPGRNDGPHLERTVADLAALYPQVRSLSIVPVGLTRWHNPDLRPYTKYEATSVLEQTLDLQAELRRDIGKGFVYPADEWFLRAGRPVPSPSAYDGLLPHLVENGVGMVSRFVDTWPERRDYLRGLKGERQIWVTGELFAPYLERYASTFTEDTGIRAEVLAVPNRAFGETVTVAGLLTVKDILAALEPHPSADVIVLPEAMFRGPGGHSLDERTPADVARVTGHSVHLVV